MGRARSTIRTPEMSAARTVGDLVAYLGTPPGPTALPFETALLLAAAWRKVTAYTWPDDWADKPLGRTDTEALLARYGQARSPVTLDTARQRMARGLDVYEEHLRDEDRARRAVEDAAADDAPADGTSALPADAGEEPDAAPADVPPTAWVDVDVRLRPDWVFSLRLPPDVTQRELRIIEGVVKAHERPD